MRSFSQVSLTLVLLLLALTANTHAKELLGETPKGSLYILDKMWVTLEPGVPPLATDRFSQGVALSGVEGIDKLNREHLVTCIEPFYRGNPKPGPIRDLVERMYILTVSSGEDILQVISEYSLAAEVDFVDPCYLPRYDYTPNDPDISNQWHLGKVRCNSAWDFYFGEVTKRGKIAIVDSGVNWYHNDLEDNMWINEPEDINHSGRFEPESAYYGGDLDFDDQDGNGWEDDVLGFDVYQYDADPDDVGSPYHGTHVAGCASEVTDNLIGGAGTGCSARLIGVRVGDANAVYNGYVGISYAADAGADLVNCSWSSDDYSYSHQQVITAVYLQGTQVVAAVGNDGRELQVYPAAYEHVIAVASTGQSDRKSDFSNYGAWVDVCAPGENIYATTPVNSYVRYSGTSMASPVACGVASLIVAQDSTRGPDDIELLLKAGCDNIDQLNPSYAGKLGAGRVNAYKTIDGDNLPRLMIADFTVGEIIGDGIGDDDGVLNPGEDGQIVVTIENTGADAINVWTYLYGDSAIEEIPDSSSYFGDIPRYGRVDNSDDPYQISVSPEALLGKVKMNLNITTEPDLSLNRGFEILISLYQVNWPVSLPGDLEASPVVYDFDNDHQYEIIVGCSNDSLYALELDGSVCPGWPVALGSDVVRAAAVGDIDGDQLVEVVAVDNNRRLYAFESDGSLINGFPVVLNAQSLCAPSLADFDHDDDLEIAVTTLAGSIYLIDGDGNVVPDWPQSLSANFHSSVAVGDLDGDQDDELVCAGLNSKVYALESDGNHCAGSWPVTLDDKIYSSPAIGDIDADGDYEVAVATEKGSIYLLEHTGEIAFGPVPAGNGDIHSHMTIANLDDTPQLEIIVGSNDKRLHVLNYDGSTYPGWPQNSGGSITCSPAVCDLDGDGVQDIITVTGNADLYAWSKDGQLLPQMPMDLGTTSVNSSPGICDMDRDGDVEIVAGLCQSTDNLVVVDYRGSTTMWRFQWVTFGHDERHTHDYGQGYTYTGEEIKAELPTDHLLLQNYPNPFNPTTTIEFALPVGSQVTLKVYNLMGQEIVTLVEEKLAAGYHEVRWNGLDNRNEEASSGVYFYKLTVGDYTATRTMSLLK
jgi:hypothetical protein